MSPHDTLREALGQVVSDLRREWRRERELIEAQARETIAELRAKIVEFEQLVRAMVETKLAQVKDGDPGKSVTLEDLAPLIEKATAGIPALIAIAVAALPAPEPGRDADPELVRSVVAEEVRAAVAALPAAKDGVSVTVEDCRAVIEAAVAEKIALLPVPKDGTSVTLEDCLHVYKEALKQAVAALPKPKDGKDGKLPKVRFWSDAVHYEGDVVCHNGSTYQAAKDTAKEPPHDDWVCLAFRGRDGRGFNIRSTWEAGAEYDEMDIVQLNGASFAARKDNPGPCPGAGWQLIAMQGKQGKPGQAVKGDRGLPGPAVAAITVNGAGLLAVTNADGSLVTCDLYPLLSRIGVTNG